jgi:single-stranded DNA-binding protein
MNYVSLSATAVSEPDRRQTPHGPVTTVRVSFETERPSPGRGFVDVVAYDRLATTLAGARRGARIALAGELGFEDWGPRGQRRSRNLVVATRLYRIDQPPEGGS